MNLIRIAPLFTLLVFGVYSGRAQRNTVYDLQLDYKHNPLGIDNKQPHFGWKINSAGYDVKQTQYQLLVGTRSHFSPQEAVWDSGLVYWILILSV